MARRTRAPARRARKSARAKRKPGPNPSISAARTFGRLTRALARRVALAAPPPPELAPALPTQFHRYTPELLANIRHRIEATTESMTSIALDCGVHRDTLRRLAQRNGWARPQPPPRDLPRAVKLAAEAATLPLVGRVACQSVSDGGRGGGDASSTTSTPTPNPSPQGGGEERVATPASNTAALPPDLPPVADTVVRMYRAALEELAAVETLRAQLKRQPHSPLDAERTARTLSSLQVVIERLQRQQLGLLNPEPEDDDDDDDFPTDIDEFRNELARRIDAFVASRAEPDDAGGEAVAARVAES